MMQKISAQLGKELRPEGNLLCIIYHDAKIIYKLIFNLFSLKSVSQLSQQMGVA
jgi:hypothetical protein